MPLVISHPGPERFPESLYFVAVQVVSVFQDDPALKDVIVIILEHGY